MEVIARDLRTFPPALIGAMQRLRRIDTENRDVLTALKEKEEKLFEELSKTEKDRKENKDIIIDEEYFTSKMQEIVAERNNVLAQMEEKISYSKTLYEFLDAKIQYIDKHTANVRHLMQDEEDPLGPSDKLMKKKKKRKREDDMVAMNSLMYKSDPNEPVYCYCRQVSYGEMVGCDNPECPIEWFHFECVGLTETPDTKWYCPDCRPLFQK